MSNEVNPIFAVTPDQARKAFDAYELLGEKNQKVTVGQRLTASIPVLGQDEAEPLTLAVLFLPPLAQAGVAGYKFGRVAKQRTAADRKAVEDLAISTVIQKANEVTFSVFLDQSQNQNAAVPPISFELLSADGSRIRPKTQPQSFVVDGRDILTAVALAENGQPLTFPLFSGAVPLLTDKMDQFTLVVQVDGDEQNLTFRLQ
jgi:hypothetical protein